MPLTHDQLIEFDRRIGRTYRHQRERAAKVKAQLPYGAGELRAYALHRLRPPDGSPGGDCHYCGRPLEPKGFELDHARPVSRGGAWELSNLVLACPPCNQAKGDLTEKEFTQLTDCINQWPPRASQSLLRRLRQAWRTFRR
ncbi:MAG: HNH endonuclease [Patescibacteria group bacterium]|nr:HNH endonuclease [Patescibacteria group bacterium]